MGHLDQSSLADIYQVMYVIIIISIILLYILCRMMQLLSRHIQVIINTFKKGRV